MPPNPIYTTDNIRTVSSIHYDWNGWLHDDKPFPDSLDQAIKTCQPIWEKEGMTLDTYKKSDHQLQCLFTASPEISPALCASRAKGRLQYAFRQLGTPVSFNRKIAVRSLGDNTSDIVGKYILKQSKKSDYIDPRFKIYLEKFISKDANIIFSEPKISGHGRYWYNLHLVIVVQDRRFPMTRDETFSKVNDACFRIAEKKGYKIAELSVMPDHIHMALRSNIEHSPLETGLCFLNNLAYMLGNNRHWSEEFYVGTFSEYKIKAITGKESRKS